MRLGSGVSHAGGSYGAVGGRALHDGLGDVAPEEDLAAERGEVGDDLLHEAQVDGAEAAGFDLGLVWPKPRSTVSSAPMWRKGPG